MSVKDPRLSQILPVIRCSDCGIDVEFRLLGEHVCSSAPPMPALPPIPAAANKPTSGLNAGAYKPGYKPPPPIPINSPQPGSPALNSFNSYNGAPLPNSPNRPGTASPRPALPFLEKYAKKNKSSSSPPVPNNNNNNGSNGSGNNVTGSPLSVSPTTPTAPSYDRQVLANGSSNHYQREQNDYFPKTPMEDRFPGSAQQPPSRSRTPMEDGRYGSNSPVPGRSKTPVNEPSAQYSPALSATRGSQPALPQKSNARSPSVNSAQGLGIQGLDANGRVKSPTGGPVYGGDPRNDYGRDPRDREWEKNNGQYGTSPPNRSGSSGSSASSVLTDRSGYPRERSNTVLSERSERSTRSNRSEREERSRYPDEYDRQRDRDGGRRETNGSTRSGRQDPSSAYKTPSPPISPEDARSVDGMSTPKQSPYRPPTPPDASPNPSRGRQPPQRMASGDRFDAMMDDLIQEINDMPSARDSSRPASSHRSRSRPNLPEGGSSRNRDLAGSPPPTPGLPGAGSGSESVRSHRSGRGERSERDREREPRSERSERDRGDRGDREQRSERERDRDRDRDRGDRGDRGDRDRSDRDRDRRSDRDRGEERGARDRERGTSSSARARSRSTNRRGAVTHCQGCKHDIQPQEAADAIKMDNGDYHAECFKCARCRRPLESARHGYEYEGRLLCEKDYQRYLEKDASRSDRPSQSGSSSSRRAALCAGCDGPIQGGETPVYALGQAWHEHHLMCYHCKRPIQQGEGHVEKNNKVYCPKDFNDLFLPKCRSCGLPVEKEAVCAQDGKLQGKWHAACFGCQTCKKPFPDKSFYVYGDAPYCRRHYHKLNNSLCKSCDQPIEGPCAQTVEGWRFHPGCFSCVECKEPLSDIYYNFENQAYCERDIMVIQRTRNVRAERRKTFFGKV